MGIIHDQLASLPERNRTHHWYLRQIYISRDEAKVWKRQKKGKLRKDNIRYAKFKPFKGLTAFIP